MRLSRTTGAGAGLLVVLLGLWAALIPFVGPYFNYGFTPNSTWHYTTDRLWLDMLPGAAAVLGGLMLIGSARRASGVMGGWLALVGGIWLLVGPSVSLFWEHPPAGVVQSGIGMPLGGHDRAAVEMIGFFYGAGALITMLSAFAIGRFTPARRVAAAAQEPAPAEERPARRGLIRRRRRGPAPVEGERGEGARRL